MCGGRGCFSARCEDPMIGPVLRGLVERGVLSVREIEEVTGRGESTVYRWLSGRTRPDYLDVRAMLELTGPDVRRELLGALLQDLPVTLIWHEAEADADTPPGADEVVQRAMDRSVEALRGMTELLAEERELLNQGGVTREHCVQLAARVDAIVQQLWESRRMLSATTARRRRAR